MFLKEDENFLSDNDKSYIDSNILSNNFPWYIQTTTVKGEKNLKKYFSHYVLRRPEERKKDEVFNSPQSEFCVNILNSFCNKHKIKVNKILRICFNLTYNNGYKKCDVHEDHNYNHKQLLIYLNNCEKESYTVVIDDDKKIKINPKKFKGVCFDKKPHYHYYPKKEIRIVLIITFR